MKEIIKNCEVVFFLIMMMFAGVFWGYIEGFLFWFLDDIGATKLEMGWTVTIGNCGVIGCHLGLFILSISGMVISLPFLVFSGPITDMVGHINVIILGMVAYCVRMVGYSFLQVRTLSCQQQLIIIQTAQDPVYVYPYEALEGFTMALMMTSAVTYVAKISTPTTIASVMGLMGSLFFGIGKTWGQGRAG